MGHKVVSTSRTPGHTKHFQTIHLTADVRLCDCPGLVFPSKLVKPLQILSGMYRIAQVQEPYSVVTFLAQRIPLPQLLNLSPPPDDMSQLSDTQPRRTQKASNKQQTQDRNTYQWSGWTICESLAILKGFLTPKAGRPDVYRAANLILRMANDGKLLLVYRPPGVPPMSFEHDQAQHETTDDGDVVAAVSDAVDHTDNELDHVDGRRGRKSARITHNMFDVLADESMDL